MKKLTKRMLKFMRKMNGGMARIAFILMDDESLCDSHHYFMELAVAAQRELKDRTVSSANLRKEEK